jgi:hypothetical protein
LATGGYRGGRLDQREEVDETPLHEAAVLGVLLGLEDRELDAIAEDDGAAVVEAGDRVGGAEVTATTGALGGGIGQNVAGEENEADGPGGLADRPAARQAHRLEGGGGDVEFLDGVFGLQMAQPLERGGGDAGCSGVMRPWNSASSTAQMSVRSQLSARAARAALPDSPPSTRASCARRDAEARGAPPWSGDCTTGAGSSSASCRAGSPARSI